MSHQRDTDLGTTISEELGRFITSNSSTFACGGSIPIKSQEPQAIKTSPTKQRQGSASSSSELTNPPVTIRWDSAKHDDGVSTTISKITFPVTGPHGEEDLAKLVRDCEPASFGFRGQDVLDDSYRKAGKMDRSCFSSDFCPYELGIIDTIAQVLLQNTEDGPINTHGIKAELYKLNIYSSPSGFFKAHVDTPRSDTQFGSLVVSLPCHHEGGQLVVRHAQHTTTFDWSSSAVASAGDAIRWAAFYSDCEHEVKELTDGHRVTLTYNLYSVPGVGDLAKHAPAMDVRSLPLYQKVKDALGEPTFMADGGNLGIYCSHAYALSTRVGSKGIPGVLKGVDMTVYAVFRALGLKVRVCQVMDWATEDENDMRLEMESDSDEEPVPNTRIGRRLGEVEVTVAGGYGEDSWQDVYEAWPHDEADVEWLTKKSEKLEELAIVHMTYGNQAGIDTKYAWAALLIEVPPATKRTGKLKDNEVTVIDDSDSEKGRDLEGLNQGVGTGQPSRAYM